MRLLIGLASMGLVVGSSPSMAQSGPPIDWQSLTPPGAGFTIELPCLAQEKANASNGTRSFACKGAYGRFGVEYSSATRSAEQLEQLAQAIIAGDSRRRLVYDRAETVQGHPARRIKIFSETEQFRAMKFVATESLLYIIVFQNKQEYTNSEDRFLGSFVLTQ